MVICESQKFLFVRIPKNASTSLATFFVQGYCNSKDKYTGIGDAGIKTQNVDQNIVNQYKLGYRFIHLTLNEIIDNGLISQSQISDMKVFGCIREPFDRQLSLYFFKKRQSKHTSPHEFQNMFRNGYCEGDNNNKILQSEYLTIRNENVGEYWLYDNLNQHLKTFQSQFNAINQISLPQYKSSMRKTLDKNELIEQYYNQSTRDAVMKYYEKDFELYEKLKNENR